MKHWNVNGPTAFDSDANYFGEHPTNMLVCPCSRTRDSGPLARSNFDEALSLLGGESETVQVHSFNHWACGWYELILIDPKDTNAVAIGEEIERRLEDYPVLNEEAYSNLEWNEAIEHWTGESLEGRMDLCRRAGISIFAARRKEFPQDDTGSLFELCRPEE